MPRLIEALGDVAPGDRLIARADDGTRVRGAVDDVAGDPGRPRVVLAAEDDEYRLRVLRGDVGHTRPRIDRAEGDEWVEYGRLVAIEAIDRR